MIMGPSLIVYIGKYPPLKNILNIGAHIYLEKYPNKLVEETCEAIITGRARGV